MKNKEQFRPFEKKRVRLGVRKEGQETTTYDHFTLFTKKVGHFTRLPNLLSEVIPLVQNPSNKSSGTKTNSVVGREKISQVVLIYLNRSDPNPWVLDLRQGTRQ